GSATSVITPVPRKDGANAAARSRTRDWRTSAGDCQRPIIGPRSPRMATLPTGTVTFLFSDIEGSTTLLQRLGDHRYAAIIAKHRRLLHAAFGEGNGKVVDTQGDAFLVAFSRARDAVGTAVAAQRALIKHAWPGDASLRVRMGLHTGEPVTETAGYVG